MQQRPGRCGDAVEAPLGIMARFGTRRLERVGDVKELGPGFRSLGSGASVGSVCNCPRAHGDLKRHRQLVRMLPWRAEQLSPLRSPTRYVPGEYLGAAAANWGREQRGSIDGATVT